MEPGVETIVLLEGREVPPGAEECLLGRVLGTMGIAQDAIGEPIAAVDVGGSQGRESIAIPSAGPLDEIRLHLGPAIREARLAASPSMEPAAR